MANHVIGTLKPIVRLLTGQALMAASSLAMQLLAGLTWTKAEFGVWSGYWLWLQLAEAIIMALIVFPLQSEEVNRNNYVKYQTIVVALSVIAGLVIPCSGFLFSEEYSIGLSIAAIGYLVIVTDRKLSILHSFTSKTTAIEWSISFVQFGIALLIYALKLPSSLAWLLIGISYLGLSIFQIRLSFTAIWTTFLRLFQKGLPQLLSSIVTWYAGNGLMLTAGAVLGTNALGDLRFAQTLLGIWNLVFQTMENYLPARLFNAYKNEVKGLFVSLLGKYSALLALSLIIIQTSLLLLITNLDVLASIVSSRQINVALLVKFSVLYSIIAAVLPWRIAYRIMDRSWEQLLVSVVLACINLLFGNYVMHTFQIDGVLMLLAIQPILYLLVMAIIIKYKPVPLCKLYILYWAKPTLTE